jgi:hypothetical protein
VPRHGASASQTVYEDPSGRPVPDLLTGAPRAKASVFWDPDDSIKIYLVVVPQHAARDRMRAIGDHLSLAESTEQRSQRD